MLHFPRRPAPPAQFQTKAATELNNVTAKINAGEKPEFENIWGNYKAEFMLVQHRKCGYCEMSTVTAPGDVEHYRPKSVVDTLKAHGRELDNLTNIRGRKFDACCERGYWWLAFEWQNYLLACEICNQKWKKALFPIAETRPANPVAASPFPCLPPKETDQETPLLMNPFDETHPELHLEFTEEGLIRARNGSAKGLFTIITCGLARPSLVFKRRTIASDIVNYIAAFLNAENQEMGILLARFIFNAGDEQKDCAGMVRILFHHLTGLSWDELEEIAA